MPNCLKKFFNKEEKHHRYAWFLLFFTIFFIIFFAIFLLANFLNIKWLCFIACFFDIKWLCFIIYFFAAILLPDWYFYIFEAKNKNLVRAIAKGRVCFGCKKYEIECQGVWNCNQIECEKFDDFSRFLGKIERAFYLIILFLISSWMDFFKIVGAWLTLKTIGNYWLPGDNKNEQSNMSDHLKRVRFVLFLLNNLISIGSVVLIYFMMQWSLGCFHECNQWCGRIKI